MNVFCYTRIANQLTITREEQAELIRESVEQKGYEIINTGCAALDARLLSLLRQKQSQVRQAIISLENEG